MTPSLRTQPSESRRNAVEQNCNDTLREPMTSFEVAEALDPVEIASLSNDCIRHMNFEDMARVVRAVNCQHLRPGVHQALDGYDANTLRRLVFLARRCCRHQLARTCQDVAYIDHDWGGDWAR